MKRISKLIPGIAMTSHMKNPDCTFCDEAGNHHEKPEALCPCVRRVTVKGAPWKDQPPSRWQVRVKPLGVLGLLLAIACSGCFFCGKGNEDPVGTYTITETATDNNCAAGSNVTGTGESHDTFDVTEINGEYQISGFGTDRPGAGSVHGTVACQPFKCDLTIWLDSPNFFVAMKLELVDGVVSGKGDVAEPTCTQNMLVTGTFR